MDDTLKPDPVDTGDIQRVEDSESQLQLSQPATPSPSELRKYILLIVFCFSNFLDSFNNTALFSAIPTIANELDITQGQSVWIISAAQLTFSAFLLVSGRITDVYDPKTAFIIGTTGFGIINLGLGFVRNKIVFFVLRAFTGIFAAMTIPSALNLIVKLFPEPSKQSMALSVFGGIGAVAGIAGLLLGAVLIEFASWPWVFYFVALIAIPLSVVSWLLIPANTGTPASEKQSHIDKLKTVDIVGVSIITTALVLFVYSLITGSSSSWKAAGVLVPLVLSVVLMGSFFYWETVIPPERAAVPPRTWFFPNFAVLIGSSLLPYFWWFTVFFIYTTLWQDVYHWSAINTAVRMLPLCIAGGAVSFTGQLSRYINTKWLMLGGQAGMFVAAIMFAFADRPTRYWSLVLPAMIIGSGGAMFTFMNTSIAVFRATPPRMAGTVGAIYNSALQLGAVVGSAAITSIETSVEKQPGKGGPTGYTARAAALWFLLGVIGITAIAVAVFYNPDQQDYTEEKEKVPTPTESTVSEKREPEP